ncbi:response regulator SirA [Anoxybacter fermentans]|uniref:Response regulator SirA n=1 Tax=Anoxybacter fermentans TaxID=1323375 RepID=A0A3Q9HNQ4_9FIRM|nr:sulfurtransferase TusA family protein [Anoxybacter fermentans]AZR72147.1 response regulator SirA [Anoxybacter fermentans]
MGDQILDCMGEACPIPLIKVEKKLAQMKKGETLIVEIDHNCAMTNIPEWARKKGYKVEIREIYFGEWEIVITKTR